MSAYSAVQGARYTPRDAKSAYSAGREHALLLRVKISHILGNQAGALQATATLNKRTTASNGATNLSGKTIYDDVFGGMPRSGAGGGPTLSPRPEDYTEISADFTPPEERRFRMQEDTETLSEGSDHSGDSRDMSNGVTHVTELQADSEYAYIIETPLEKTENKNPLLRMTDDIELEFTGGVAKRNIFGKPTLPSDVLPPTRPPPPADVKNQNCRSVQHAASRGRTGDSLPPFFDVEIDASSCYGLCFCYERSNGQSSSKAEKTSKAIDGSSDIKDDKVQGMKNMRFPELHHKSEKASIGTVEPLERREREEIEETPERENEKKRRKLVNEKKEREEMKEAREREENEKRLKEASHLQEENKRRQRKALELEEMERKQREACEKDENKRRPKQVREQGKMRGNKRRDCKRLEEACEKENIDRMFEEAVERNDYSKVVKWSKTEDEVNQEVAGQEETEKLLGVNCAYQQTARVENEKKQKTAGETHLHGEGEDPVVSDEANKMDYIKKCQENHLVGNNDRNCDALEETEESIESEKTGAELTDSGRKLEAMGQVSCHQNDGAKKADESVIATRSRRLQGICNEGKGSTKRTVHQVKISQSMERKDENINESLTPEEKEAERLKRERELESERLRKMEEDREREREREKDRMAVDSKVLEAREWEYAEAQERAGKAERATAEARQRAMAEARDRLEKACAEAREKSSMEARLRAERAAVERATAEARERAVEKIMAERAAFEARERSMSDNFRLLLETVNQLRVKPERYQRTAERAAKALEEKNMRNLLAQREQAERNRLAETLDADVKRWSSGKEGNLRALLSTLQYILGPDSGWQPIPLTEVITSAAVKKAYRKATLCVHPDKLQQRGASIHQKYICEKVFDLLKEAWNKFNSEER
ncbi:hypothetical protein F3Y22_tig00110813pilonHSYRG00023 [Hibiscus syriacus]|uniref:J domain-containing protein n=1 Tax=Hibiscus syriacus TaxID=106335 RepID=A0A6A2ZN32_HIBSY|nr:hypothetical protein F3Y22_tig00110813pilonHSYRG00023 [Hibiscus syriacus]